MTSPLRSRLITLAILAAGCHSVAIAQSPSVTAASGSSVAPGRPSVTIQSPAMGAVVQGVAIIRFRAENVAITSLFVPAEKGPLPAAHLHVSVDGASWHWVHSTTDPVVVTPLSPGEHTVTLELAAADHRPLDVQTVRFTVVARVAAATEHEGHH